VSESARTWLKRLLIVPPAVLGLAVLAWHLGRETAPEQGEPREVMRAVRVMEAMPLDFVPRATGYGTVQPSRTWEAVAQVGGQIVHRHPELERGRLLAADTLILRIDATDHQLAVVRGEAALESARAQLAELEVREENLRASLEIERRGLTLAQDSLARQQELLERGSVPQSAVDEAETRALSQRQRVQELDNQLRLIPAERRVLEASIAQGQAQLEEARLNVERTAVRMPFDGRIAQVSVEPLQFVSVGQVIAVVDGIEAAEIEAQFPLGRIAHLVRADIDLAALPAHELADVPHRFGLEATVHLRTDDMTASWEARFERLSDRIDPQTRTAGLIVAVDDPYRQAIPGRRPPLAKDMFVEVELRGRPWEEALVVPRVAVQRRSDRGAVLYLAGEDDRLEIREITLGPTQGDLVVVSAGLSPGERVVVTDLIPAIEGMRLEPHLDLALAERLRAQATGRLDAEARLR
jgi:membrane fusion protein, multidrug efflux system